MAVPGRSLYRESTTDDARHSMHQINPGEWAFLPPPPKDAPGPDAPAGEGYGDVPF